MARLTLELARKEAELGRLEAELFLSSPDKAHLHRRSICRCDRNHTLTKQDASFRIKTKPDSDDDRTINDAKVNSLGFSSKIIINFIN